MNKNENYIMINGHKIPLTSEQFKFMKEGLKKSPFDRVGKKEQYYYVGLAFETGITHDTDFDIDRKLFDIGNYCTDENIMKQHALHMMLNNLLWRYSMTHGGDEIDWQDMCEAKYRIFYNCRVNDFQVDYNSASISIGAVYFTNPKTAEAAIEEIVKPFIAEHPDFDLTKM